MGVSKLLPTLCIGCMLSFSLSANDSSLQIEFERPSSLTPTKTASPSKPQKAEVKESNEVVPAQLVKEAPQAEKSEPLKEKEAPTLAKEEPQVAPKIEKEEEVQLVKEVPKAKEIPSSTSITADTQTSTFRWNPPENCAKTVPNTFTRDEDRMYIYHATHIDDVQPRKSLFFQTNIGIGFLYFSGVKGDLMLEPQAVASFRGAFVSTPLKGRLTYNRTPLYEYILGWRLLPWFKAGLSYQYQGGVSVQTWQLPTGAIRPQLTSYLSLNGLFLKTYFELPYPLIWGYSCVSPYLGLGVGPAWQSWTNIDHTQTMLLRTDALGEVNYLKNSLKASAAWMFDLGFRFQRLTPYNVLSMSMGIKYNQWGQARNIGKYSQQGYTKIGLFKPFRIRTVYQWAPYLGVQWNFSPSWTSKSPYMIAGKTANSWKPFVVNLNQIEGKGSISTEFNVGIGFLYMNKVMGIVREDPAFENLFNKNYGPITENLSYNRTPLFEYLIGYRALSWFRPSFSYQYQSGISVQTQRIPSVGNVRFYRFISNLSLNAIMAKCFFELPFPLIWKNVATTLYASAGVGPSWQSWTRSRVNMLLTTTGGAQFYNDGPNMPIRQKISANAALGVDMGLRMQSAFPNSPYSIKLGCKYNYWGQARNIGLISQQGSFKYLNVLFKIKHIHQFAPYMGFQWSFLPTCVSESPYMIANKRTNTWVPYFTNSSALNRRDWKWVQFNAGIGFLYFSGVRGSFLVTPPRTLLSVVYGFVDAPLKQRLSYNRTPLFEYIIGTNVMPYLKAGLSYQHQGGVTVQTEMLSAFTNPNTTNRNCAVRFTSDLSLDAIMAKFYIETPWTMIWKNLSMSPYLALGVGPGWQTWSQPNVINLVEFNSGLGDAAQLNLRQEISANCAWMFDLGFNTRAARPDSAFSVWTGIKYNQWGQARNIGSSKKHGNLTYGLFKPFTIRTVYQWAPYIGVQWNF